jgi:MSHA biogenesis protein MshO
MNPRADRREPESGKEFRAPVVRVAGSRHRAQGFTLVELVVSMVLTGIVVSFMAMFITAPVQAYRGQTRRADLVDTADSVLRLMGRDIHAALPNSVRIIENGNFSALEVLETVDAARYRDSDSITAPASELDFSAADGAFATLGELEIPSDLGSSQYYLSIYNVGITGANAYDLANVITPSGTTISITNPGSGESMVTLLPPFRFTYGSPGRRVFLVRGPVTYLCDRTTGTITRYARYPITGAQRSTTAAFAGVSGAAMANNVTRCQFTYLAGTSSRAGLVTLDITVARTDTHFGAATESVRLLHQVHVENVP